jgi:hypothetical protein
MTTVQYATLAPTGDPVTYLQDQDVVYPDSNVVDTFGVLWASKLFANQMDTLELGSAGKAAFSLCNMHALDMGLVTSLVSASSSNVQVRARAAMGVELANEPRSAVLELADSGDASFTACNLAVEAVAEATIHAAAGSNHVSVGAAGIALDAGVGSNVFTVAEASGHAFRVGATEVLSVGSNLATLTNARFSGSNLKIPTGPTAQRPPLAGSDPGQIFYNTTTGRFEGRGAVEWSGLGGAESVDGKTKVETEFFPGSGDNNLRISTSNTERLRVTEDGLIGIGTSNPTHLLEVEGGNVKIHDTVFMGRWYSSNNSAHSGQLSTETITLGVSKDNIDALPDDVVDGAGNSGAGVVVAGLPNQTLATNPDEIKDRFQKSFKWNTGGGGMGGLGKRLEDGGARDESFWELKGGAFQLTHTNPKTGGEVGYALRINDSDQLEVVRKVKLPQSSEYVYTRVAKFGDVQGDRERISKGVGSVDINIFASILRNTANPITLDVKDVATFNAFSDYNVYAAAYPAASNPTSIEVKEAAIAGFGFTNSSVPRDLQNTVTTVTFPTLFDGSAFGASNVPKVAFAFEEIAAGSNMNVYPFEHFVIMNDVNAAQVAALQGDVDSSNGQVVFDVRFVEFSWSNLNTSQQEAFTAWLEGEIMQSFLNRGITPEDISIDVTTGSILATVTAFLPVLQMNTAVASVVADPEKLVADGGNPKIDLGLDALGNPVRLKMVDDGDDSFPLTKPEVKGKTDGGVGVRQKAAKIEVTTTTTSGETAGSKKMQLAVTNPLSVDRVYVYVSSTEIKNPTPSKIKRSALAQASDNTNKSGVYTFSEAKNLQVESGAEETLFVYTTVQDTGAALTKVSEFVAKPMSVTVPASVSVLADGTPILARLVEGTGSVKVYPGFEVNTESDAVTSHLIMYPDLASVPPTADGLFAEIDSGARNVSAQLERRDP